MSKHRIFEFVSYLLCYYDSTQLMSLHRGLTYSHPSSSSSEKKKIKNPAQNPPLSHSHYPPCRPHRREIIFHAKLTRPMQRDFPLTPCHSSAEKRHKMRGWRESRQAGKGREGKGREGIHPFFIDQSRVSESSKLNDSLRE